MPPPSILLVEDNSDDIRLLREALADCAAPCDLWVADCLATAWNMLVGLPDDELPALVITDHHLPDGCGQALIARLQGKPAYSRVPVVMVSGDATRPTDLGPTPWFGKPDTWRGWCTLAHTLIGRLAVN